MSSNQITARDTLKPTPWKVPEYYRAFESQWSNMGYPDWNNRQPADLNYPVNPIFNRFQGSTQLFTSTHRDYRMIEPAVRLASAFLSSPASIRFIYSLVYERQRLPSKFDFKDGPCYQFRQTKETDPNVILPRVDVIFKATALHNEWYVLVEVYSATRKLDSQQTLSQDFTDLVLYLGDQMTPRTPCIPRI